MTTAGQALRTSVRLLSELTDLTWGHQGVSGQCTMVHRVISLLPGLQSLTLLAGAAGMADLSQMMCATQLTQLTRLRIASRGEVFTLARTCAALSSLRQLRLLELCFDRSHERVPAMAIPGMPQLQDLHLSNVRLEGGSECLRACISLTHLMLSSVDFIDESEGAWLLEAAPTLRELMIRQSDDATKVDAGGTIRYGRALKYLPALTSLKMVHFYFALDTANALASALAACTQLQCLWLEYAPAVDAMADTLAALTGLQELKLSQSCLSATASTLSGRVVAALALGPLRNATICISHEWVPKDVVKALQLQNEQVRLRK